MVIVNNNQVDYSENSSTSNKLTSPVFWSGLDFCHIDGLLSKTFMCSTDSSDNVTPQSRREKSQSPSPGKYLFSFSSLSVVDGSLNLFK